MSSECNQFRAEGQPCSGWDAMRTHIQELEIKLNDAEYDRDRWHKAFLDAKYPEMLPTRVDLEARIADLEAQLLKSSPEHQAQMKWARDVVRQVVIPLTINANTHPSVLLARIWELEAALHEIADFSEQFIGDDEDGDERMYKVNQIADTALAQKEPI